jgi:hypothetical protein
MTTSSVELVVMALERHYRRVEIDGDVDVVDLNHLLDELYDLECDITPAIAKRAKVSVEALEIHLRMQMKRYSSVLGDLQKGEKALRRYSGKNHKRRTRIFRNV